MADELALKTGEGDVRRLEDEIARKRERLAVSLAELREEVGATTDWRVWYDRHPLAFLGTAFLAGWIFGQVRTGSRG